MENNEPDYKWFDLWHTHPNDEDTDQRWANLLSEWERADEAGQNSGQPWQSWLVIEPPAPQDDAVYLHTPNPNEDNFPYQFEDVEWGVLPPAWMVPSTGLEFGQSNYGGIELLWVRRLPEAPPITAPTTALDRIQ